MSLKLILMRHAKSGWDDPVEDHDRPLNSRGRISAKVMEMVARKGTSAAGGACINCTPHNGNL